MEEKTLKGSTGKASVGSGTSSIRITFAEAEFKDYDEMKRYLQEAQSHVTIVADQEQGALFEGDTPPQINSVVTVRQFSCPKDSIAATFSFTRSNLENQRLDIMADTKVKVIMQRVADAPPAEPGEGEDDK